MPSRVYSSDSSWVGTGPPREPLPPLWVHFLRSTWGNQVWGRTELSPVGTLNAPGNYLSLMIGHCKLEKRHSPSKRAIPIKPGGNFGFWALVHSIGRLQLMALHSNGSHAAQRVTAGGQTGRTASWPKLGNPVGIPRNRCWPDSQREVASPAE